jgi:hypothetical protein
MIGESGSLQEKGYYITPEYNLSGGAGIAFELIAGGILAVIGQAWMAPECPLCLPVLVREGA